MSMATEATRGMSLQMLLAQRSIRLATLSVLRLKVLLYITSRTTRMLPSGCLLRPLVPLTNRSILLFMMVKVFPFLLEFAPLPCFGIPAAVISDPIDRFQMDDQHADGTVYSVPLLSRSLILTAQVNACILRAHTKLEHYLKQFHQAAVHVFGAQETRRNKHGISTEGSFIVDTACNPDSSGGIMFGISNKLPFAAEAPGCCLPLSIAASDVSALVSRPQSAFVRVAAPRFQVLYVVIHGPDASYPREHVCTFWDIVYTDFVDCVKSGDNVACLFNGSRRITTRHGDDDLLIGDALDPPWRHSHVTDAVSRVCRRSNVVIANTFQDLNALGGDHGSLFVSSNFAIRCDYIGVSLNVSVQPHSLSAWHGFRMLNAKPDHLPIRMTATYGCSTSTPVARRRKAAYNRQAIYEACSSSDPVVLRKVALLDEYLLDVELILVCIEPPKHRFLLGDFALKGLQLYFPSTERQCKQKYMSVATFKIVEEKAIVAHALTPIVLKISLSPITFVVRVWRSRVKYVRCVLARCGSRCSPGCACGHKPTARPWRCPVRGSVSRIACLAQRRLSCSFARLRCDVRVAADAVFLRSCISQATALEEAALEWTSRHYSFATLRSLQPWEPLRGLRLLDANGLPADSDHSEHVTVKKHFQGTLLGQDCLSEGPNH